MGPPIGVPLVLWGGLVRFRWDGSAVRLTAVPRPMADREQAAAPVLNLFRAVLLLRPRSMRRPHPA